MVHRHALYQGQSHVMEILEHADGTVVTDGVFHDLQGSTASQFTQGKEERPSNLLPQQGEQCQNIQRPFSHHTIILEESILNARVMGVQHHVKLWFRICIHQAEYHREQYKIRNHIDVKRLQKYLLGHRYF